MCRLDDDAHIPRNEHTVAEPIVGKSLARAVLQAFDKDPKSKLFVPEARSIFVMHLPNACKKVNLLDEPATKRNVLTVAHEILVRILDAGFVKTEEKRIPLEKRRSNLARAMRTRTRPNERTVANLRRQPIGIELNEEGAELYENGGVPTIRKLIATDPLAFLPPPS